MKKTIATVIVLTTLAGCGSMAKFKNQTDAQTSAVSREFVGRYAVVDSRGRGDYQFKEIELIFDSEDGGRAIGYDADGKKVITYGLYGCEIANQAQAENSGKPVESIENIVRCTVFSNSYRYAEMYVAKVKSDYLIQDQALISQYKPMGITSGYLITVKTGIGSGLLVNAKKTSADVRK
jgi:hypothetical protein